MGFEWVQAAAGLGLFLLGMVTLTDGLRQIAGDALQRLLRRFTRSPATGAATGAVLTAIVQSSSAVTVSAVGFAGAGLLRFPEALGIVFGANIGTTITGWMVALLGFKLKLGSGMPFVLLAGVLLRLFARGRAGSAGTALAGFALVFLGIDALREGLAGLGTWLPTADLSAEGVGGRLLLVGVGVAITLVTQSSSAGVATALAALSSGAISFPQATSLVIGMDVGTTSTAVMATVGGSLAARRTGWAHVLYNLGNGLLAFNLAPLYVLALDALAPGAIARQPEIALVGFHTGFNTLGVLISLSVAHRFAALVERLVPARSEAFARRLDASLLREPDLALRALVPVIADLCERSFAVLRSLLRSGREASPAETVGLLTIALDEVQHYVGRIDAPAPTPASRSRRVATLHLIDQLRRLLGREAQTERADVLQRDPELRSLANDVAKELVDALALPEGEAEAWPEARLEARRALLHDRREAFRTRVAQRASRDGLEAESALERMDAYRWLERVTHHAWRVVHHLEQMRRELPTPLAVEPSEPE